MRRPLGGQRESASIPKFKRLCLRPKEGQFCDNGWRKPASQWLGEKSPKVVLFSEHAYPKAKRKVLCQIIARECISGLAQGGGKGRARLSREVCPQILGFGRKRVTGGRITFYMSAVQPSMRIRFTHHIMFLYLLLFGIHTLSP